MPIDITDLSGTIRSPDDFRSAHDIIVKRIVQASAVPQDVELFMAFTTIIDALKIAEAVAKQIYVRKP